jgi:hypothetical protein
MITHADSVLIYLHIPKTGGTTLSEIVRRQYAGASILQINDTRVERIEALLPDARAHADVLVGHVPFGVHRYLRTPHVYFTLLRHPVERVVSQYHHVLRRADHPLHDHVTGQGLSLEEYVGARLTRAINNGQTRMLCGLPQADPFNLLPHDQGIAFGECPTEMLLLAQQNLRDQIAVAGITECFDESVVLMKRRLGWHWPVYVRRDVARGHPPISAEARRLIESINQQDMSLYELGARLFGEAVAGEGPSFWRDLYQFRALNSAYQARDKLRRLARRAKARLQQ